MSGSIKNWNKLKPLGNSPSLDAFSLDQKYWVKHKLLGFWNIKYAKNTDYIILEKADDIYIPYTFQIHTRKLKINHKTTLKNNDCTYALPRGT